MPEQTVPTLVSYYPKPGHEAALEALVRSHYGVLRRHGLASARPAQVFRAHDKDTGKAHFVELFEWVSENASDIAHQTPEVMAVWEPMETHMTNMTIARVEPLS